jgi:hypothetical protein
MPDRTRLLFGPYRSRHRLDRGANPLAALLG